MEKRAINIRTVKSIKWKAVVAFFKTLRKAEVGAQGQRNYKAALNTYFTQALSMFE